MSLTLMIFETSRNKLIEVGLIKDKPTSWCKKMTGMKNRCMICTADAMCTKRDAKTGKIRNTFIKRYKKDHRVMRYNF